MLNQLTVFNNQGNSPWDIAFCYFRQHKII